MSLLLGDCVVDVQYSQPAEAAASHFLSGHVLILHVSVSVARAPGMLRLPFTFELMLLISKIIKEAHYKYFKFRAVGCDVKDVPQANRIDFLITAHAIYLFLVYSIIHNTEN